MNFIEMNLKLIAEIEGIKNDRISGKISRDLYRDQMGGIAQIGKGMERHIKFLHTERIMKISLNNVGSKLVEYDPSKDKIKCPILEKTITRKNCLDYSGSNTIKCLDSHCEHNIDTKDLLLGEK